MEREAKLIKFPKKLIEQIKQYQEENAIGSFSAAVYELIRKGLEK